MSDTPTNAKGIAPGTFLDGRFEIERLLGRGGMGEVWRVLDHETMRRRALKVLLDEHKRDQLLQTRFRLEAKIRGLAGNHPGIVDVVAADQLSDGRQYLLMELLEGADFESFSAMQPEQRISFEDALLALALTCDAIGAAHERSILHRDIKPSNLFRITRDDLRVLDFGLARQGAASAMTNFACGTPGYMSPEQANNPTAVTTRTDVFALGATLYRLLSGRTPRGTESPSLDLVAPFVPREARLIIQRAMAPSPDDRFRTARELLQALLSAFPALVPNLSRMPPPVPAGPPHSRSEPGVEIIAISAAPGADAVRLKNRLRQARSQPTNALAAVDAVQRELEAMHLDVMFELLEALRALDVPASTVAVIEEAGSRFKADPRVQQHLGFALNRLGRRDEAEQVLVRLVETKPTPEHHGLLGRVYKDRYDDALASSQPLTAKAFLKRAIETYLAGHRLEPTETYCAINALTLMELVEPIDARRAPLLLEVLETLSKKEPRQDDYWDQATRLEVAVLSSDEKSAMRLLDSCLNAAAGAGMPFALRTTARNLSLLRLRRASVGTPEQWIEKVERTLQGMAHELEGAVKTL
ncbi:MAG: DUF4071 domain-containing protein [Archangium sp.]|nr:DUF4071 domain-containing protein [Archangium sp.]